VKATLSGEISNTALTMKKSTPKVSIIMSVFNGEAFLQAAISSILAQTLPDFEFLIMDDGSTDSTAHILKAQTDPRITIMHQPNQGLVASLNTLLAKASGSYIARMDADDLADPERLQLQVEYLDHHPTCAVLASRIKLIDEGGLSLPPWGEDLNATSSQEIRQYLPVGNCIAHPSIMARADILTHYGYRDIPGSEDYELWLRMAADGLRIDKLRQPLLSYRVHRQSITQLSKKGSVTMKILRVKLAFLIFRLGRLRFGAFELQVLRSVIMVVTRAILQRSKYAIAIPLAALERRLVRIPSRPTQKPGLLFLLPWVTVGGADKVMLDLAVGLPEFKSHVLTTEPSDNPWSQRFIQAGAVVEHLPHSLRFRRNYPWYIAQYVKRNHIHSVLISNSRFGYQAAPQIKKIAPKVRVIDILHGQGGVIDDGSAPTFSLPYQRSLDDRITVTNYLQEYMHATFDIPKKRFTPIHNGIDINAFKDSAHTSFRKQYGIDADAPVIAWVGRLSDEKKPLLVAEIARTVAKTHPNCYFLMAGEGPVRPLMAEAIKDYDLTKQIILLGNCDDVSGLMQESNIVLLTSEMEGYSITLVEAQALGVPVVATQVGGNGEVVQQGKTGLLVPYDAQVADHLAEAINQLLGSPKRLTAMRQEALKTNGRLSINLMLKAYREVING
jgi:glycosyltransferase involved in cell wall biosynthesis